MLDILQTLFALGLWLPIVAIGLGCLNGGCACEDCEICSDNFDRADDTDVDTGSSCGWTETAGSWEIVSNTLRTASSSAKLTCDATHPDATPTHYVECELYGATGDELRIGVGDHYAQLTIGDPNGCLALYTAAGTLLTKIRVDAAATTTHTLKVWYGTAPVADGGDSQIAAQLGSGTVVRYNVTRAGTSVYLGTGTVASTVRFDNFQWQRHYTTATDDLSCPYPAAPTCTIVTDNFTRADDTNIGCGWTETAGGWEISGNKLVTSSASAKATCETIHPQAASTYHVAVTVRATVSGTQIRVYTDVAGNNYAQLTIGTSQTLKVFVAGVEEESVVVTTAIDTDYLLNIVQFGNVLHASLGSACAGALSANPAGPVKAALGTGTNTGTVTFDSYTLSRGKDSENPDCLEGCNECSDCDAGTVPNFIDFTVAGVTVTDPILQPFADFINATHRLVPFVQYECTYTIPQSRNVAGITSHLLRDPPTDVVWPYEWLNIDGTNLWMRWRLELQLSPGSLFVFFEIDHICDGLIHAGPPLVDATTCNAQAVPGCLGSSAFFNGSFAASNCKTLINSVALTLAAGDANCIDASTATATVATDP